MINQEGFEMNSTKVTDKQIESKQSKTGHSLRRGLATSASLAGANLAAIMRQGRWKQVNTIMEYVDATNRFSDNAVTTILKDII